MKMFTDLSDQELVTETKRLAAAERRATAALIRSLMELDARRLYLGEGCASLFKYCTEVLRLSEDAAYNRMEVARTARRIPAILDAIERGELTLTAARRLGPHLTPLNCGDALAAARFKTKAEIEELIAALSPKPDVAPTIRKLPDAALVHAPVPVAQRPVEPAPVAAAGVERPQPTSEVRPLAPERYKIQFTIGRETRDKLREVQDLLRHSIPNGDLADIFDRALTLLLKDTRKRRFANTDAPRPGRPLAPDSRAVPSEVRRVVWKRDDSRCAFIGPNGRCTETSFLQFHHKDPFAMGGDATVDNIELRCAAHNRYEAELFFGVKYRGIVREARPVWPNEEFRSGTNSEVSSWEKQPSGVRERLTSKAGEHNEWHQSVFVCRTDHYSGRIRQGGPGTEPESGFARGTGGHCGAWQRGVGGENRHRPNKHQ